MKYRKVKLLLGAALLALAVTACGGEKEADSETAQAEEAADLSLRKALCRQSGSRSGHFLPEKVSGYYAKRAVIDFMGFII